jgi:fructose-specific phosphotransferase system IIC component
VAGLISAVYFRLIYKRVNDHLHFDSYGIMNILIISFVGTFVLAPIILITYYNRDWILTTLEVSNFDYIGKPLVSASIVGWILAYVGISMGIAIVSGTLSALLLSGLGNNNVKGSYNQ